MQRFYLPFLIFAALLILTIPLSFDYATSVVPGWHATIFPPYFLIDLSITVILLIVAVGYWKLARKGYNVRLIVFVTHLLLTIPTVILIRFQFQLWDIFMPVQNDIIEWVNREINLIIAAYALFIVGQILFVIQFFRIKGFGAQRTKN